MVQTKFFRILKNDQTSQARLGEIRTSHGSILTPAFVPVGTQASVKSLTPQELEMIGTQVFIVNTYHIYLRPGSDVIAKFGGLHQFMNWPGPLATDSGGFQIFSFGRSDLVKIDDEGVTFKSHLDGSSHRFTPEKSMAIQGVLGADIMMAFDECVPYPTTLKDAKVAMNRTHRWALRSLESQDKLKKGQALFGVVQGSVFEDLRKASARYIGSLPFDGIALGGMAVGEGKEKMSQCLDWTVPCLPIDKPRHLLGVGELDDVFRAIERDVDTMDCVMPTRLGRMGQILVGKSTKTIDITKKIYRQDTKSLDENCSCFVCQNFAKAYLHHLFRAQELLAYRLATFHNLFVVESLFSQIRQAIQNGHLKELKKQWLKN